MRHQRSMQAYAACLGIPLEQALPRLQQARVTVLGCGGLGGHVLELLARSGVGTLRLVDDDHFTESNLNRQTLCTASTLGIPKVEAAALRIRDIDESICVETHFCRLHDGNAKQLLRNSDVVVDALDNIPSRRIAAAAAAALDLSLVYGAVAGFMGLAAVIFPGNPLLENLYPMTGAENVPEHQHSAGVASPTPALIASIQVAESLKILLGMSNSRLLQGKFFLCDLAAPFASIVPLNIERGG